MKNPDREADHSAQRPGQFRFNPQLHGLSLDSIPSGRIPLKVPPIHRMGSDEIPYQPLSSVARARSRAVSHANRYPDPAARVLTETIARHHDVPPNQVAVGVGSVGVLTQLVTATGNADFLPRSRLMCWWSSTRRTPSSSATRAPLTGSRSATISPTWLWS